MINATCKSCEVNLDFEDQSDMICPICGQEVAINTNGETNDINGPINKRVYVRTEEEQIQEIMKLSRVSEEEAWIILEKYDYDFQKYRRTIYQKIYSDPEYAKERAKRQRYTKDEEWKQFLKDCNGICPKCNKRAKGWNKKKKLCLKCTRVPEKVLICELCGSESSSKYCSVCVEKVNEVKKDLMELLTPDDD